MIREQIFRFFTELTPGVKKLDYRTFVVLNGATVGAMLLHVLVLPMFMVTGAWPIVAFNALSFMAYGAALWFNRRGWHFLCLSVSLGELIAHQALCVLFLGLGAGFQYYILCVTGMVFFLPRDRMFIKAFMLLTTALSMVGLYHLGWTNRPIIDASGLQLTVIHDVNLVSVVFTLGAFSYIYARAAEIAEDRLKIEQKKVEDLLHSILPISIARRLRDRPEVIADRFESATVLFADMVGFTPMSARMTPTNLVALLNEVFSDFDELVEHYGLEKIKTIGDAYMVAAGIPETRLDHARATALLALDMQQAMARRAHLSGIRLLLRVGIHTGPVVAGIIGKRKFLYDLWGDTVNTASRIESHCQPGEVHVSDELHALLCEDFILEDRGVVDMKGKGLIRRWALIKRAPALPPEGTAPSP